MGMYTELVIAANVKDVSEAVAVLKYLTQPSDLVPNLPDHPFFKTPRWRWLFQSCSYYFVPTTMSKFEFDKIGSTWSLIARSDLKNYDSEIEHFIDWLRPHLEAEEDTMIGYSRYEGTREPTIYYGANPQ